MKKPEQLAGKPSSLSKDRYNEFPLFVVFEPIELFELIEHAVNFSMRRAFRAHFGDFQLESPQHRLDDAQQMGSIHVVNPSTASNNNTLGKPG
jgi:hypothetical protein